MCKSVEGVSGPTGKFLDWTAWVARVLVIPTLLIFGTMWWNHEARLDEVSTAVEVMRGNRFTSADALSMQKDIADVRAELKQQEIDTLRRQLLRLQGKERTE